MPDESPKTALTWLEEPQVIDGAVVYAYRNDGDAAAVFVSETVNISPHDATNVVQSYVLDELGVGAEQRTQAPAPLELPDGPARVIVTVDAASSPDAIDAHLEHELAAVVTAGILRSAEATADVPAASTLEVDVVSFELDGSEAVLHYRITGDTPVAFVSAFAGVGRGVGNPAWMSTVPLEPDREDIIRIPIPFDQTVDEEEGWTLSITISAADKDSTIQAGVAATMPLRLSDGVVVGDSGWSTLSVA